jgi:hypothetical protein
MNRFYSVKGFLRKLKEQGIEISRNTVHIHILRGNFSTAGRLDDGNGAFIFSNADIKKALEYFKNKSKH